jgi:hypothetical protein
MQALKAELVVAALTLLLGTAAFQIWLALRF